MKNLKPRAYGHTPGPWTVTNDTYRTIKAGKTPIATLTMRYYNQLFLANAEANARLIAAAPDLLEALVNIFRSVDGNGVPDHMKDGSDSVRVNIPSTVLQNAMSIITKATQETD